MQNISWFQLLDCEGLLRSFIFSLIIVNWISSGFGLSAVQNKARHSELIFWHFADKEIDFSFRTNGYQRVAFFLLFFLPCDIFWWTRSFDVWMPYYVHPEVLDGSLCLDIPQHWAFLCFVSPGAIFFFFSSLLLSNPVSQICPPPGSVQVMPPSLQCCEIDEIIFFFLAGLSFSCTSMAVPAAPNRM